MNQSVFVSRRKETQEQIKEWWSKLTDDDLERTNGKLDQLIGLIQQKYGYTRERAVEEFSWRLRGVRVN